MVYIELFCIQYFELWLPVTMRSCGPLLIQLPTSNYNRRNVTTGSSDVTGPLRDREVGTYPAREGASMGERGAGIGNRWFVQRTVPNLNQLYSNIACKSCSLSTVTANRVMKVLWDSRGADAAKARLRIEPKTIWVAIPAAGIRPAPRRCNPAVNAGLNIHTDIQYYTPRKFDQPSDFHTDTKCKDSPKESFSDPSPDTSD